MLFLFANMDRNSSALSFKQSDLSLYLNLSNPSISRALKVLKNKNVFYKNGSVYAISPAFASATKNEDNTMFTKQKDGFDISGLKVTHIQPLFKKTN